MSNKKSSTKSADASAGKGKPTPKRNAAKSGGKGKPTPKRNVDNKKQVAEQNRSANRQWFIIGFILVSIVAAIIILGTIFGDPYDPVQSYYDALQENNR